MSKRNFPLKVVSGSDNYKKKGKTSMTKGADELENVQTIL
jgi:hypothetical protein